MVAMLCHCVLLFGNSFDYAGWLPNYLELGGVDTALYCPGPLGAFKIVPLAFPTVNMLSMATLCGPAGCLTTKKTVVSGPRSPCDQHAVLGARLRRLHAARLGQAAHQLLGAAIRRADRHPAALRGRLARLRLRHACAGARAAAPRGKEERSGVVNVVVLSLVYSRISHLDLGRSGVYTLVVPIEST